MNKDVEDLAANSFKIIAPFWPLQNLIAVNPLQGFEELSIEEAITQGAAYFQQSELPNPMQEINRETIKWLQVYLDEGQSTISMPLRQKGLYTAWRQLAIYDRNLHKGEAKKKEWLNHHPKTAEEAIIDSLERLEVAKENHIQFLKILLSTLPGWASYIKYRTEWPGETSGHLNPITQIDYLALRLIITRILWPEANELLTWHDKAMKSQKMKYHPLKEIEENERNYRLPLLKSLASQTLKEPQIPAAQFVFCIDVRSEPFRRSLETTGNYQTFGFAGFFGIPVKITDTVTGNSYASCPVLLKPKHEIKEYPCCTKEHSDNDLKGYLRLTEAKRLYQSVKYTFTTPFALVETLGLASGAWMCLKSLFPSLASRLKTKLIQTIRKPAEIEPCLDSINFDEQCAYAEGALVMMGLTHHFAPLVLFCGHGSTTQNNAYATALDCGACGGRHGAGNARILAAILNRDEVRNYLLKKNISIPKETRFIAAEHNTTTDEFTIFGANSFDQLDRLKQDLEKAKSLNSAIRLRELQKSTSIGKAEHQTWIRSQDWAQVRPEWGLARNAAFIVAPRDTTASVDLNGRCFLHSYDYTQDPEGSFLTVILTAPMVVAQWINTQYLFSTLDNVAYGGGSKITKNITGKIGVMQGNASDLMTGLPLQSVYSNDMKSYHEPQRLMTVVAAPKSMLDKIIQTRPVLQKLFGNGWVQLACIDPQDRKTYFLNRDLIWQKNQ